MELCDDSGRHEQICYAGKNCPVCEKMDRLAEDVEYITDLENEIKDLKSRLEGE